MCVNFKNNLRNDEMKKAHKICKNPKAKTLDFDVDNDEVP